MLNRLIDHFRPPAIRTLPAFRRFVSGEASYLAQRSTYEFTRNTLAWYGQHAFADDRFNDAFRVCRWEAYAALTTRFVLLARARRDVPGAAAWARAGTALADQAAAMLAEYPLPPHRQAWDDILDALRLRLVTFDPVAPPGPAALGDEAAAVVYPTLPARSGNATEDREVIANALRFGTIAVNDRLGTRLDRTAILGQLLAEGAPR